MELHACNAISHYVCMMMNARKLVSLWDTTGTAPLAPRTISIIHRSHR